MGRKCASVSCHCHETGRQQGHPSPDLGMATATARGPVPSRKLPPWPQAAATASERRTKNDYGTLCKWAGKLQLTCLLAGNQSGKPRITVTTQNRKNKKIYIHKRKSDDNLWFKIYDSTEKYVYRERVMVNIVNVFLGNLFSFDFVATHREYLLDYTGIFIVNSHCHSWYSRDISISQHIAQILNYVKSVIWKYYYI